MKLSKKVDNQFSQTSQKQNSNLILKFRNKKLIAYQALGNLLMIKLAKNIHNTHAL
jgi:hypothetical protein